MILLHISKQMQPEKTWDKFFASLIQKIDNQEISLKLFIKNEERVPKIDKIQEAFKKEIKNCFGKRRT